MNTKQYKNRVLIRQVDLCLRSARLCLLSRVPARNFQSEAVAADALSQLNRALSFARQLPVNGKHLAIRAHIVSAIEAWHHA